MKKCFKTTLKQLASLSLLLTFILSLTACDSQETVTSSDTIPATETATAIASTNIEADTTTNKVSNEPGTLEETTEEPSLELSDPVVYEGIDMESDLPAIEWIATFEGIIDEPQMIIANDLTNKKVIVESGSTIKFAMDDTLLFWFPNRELLTNILLDNNTFTNRSYSDSINWEDYLAFFPSQNWECNFISNISGKYPSGDTVTTTNVITYDGEEIELTANLILE